MTEDEINAEAFKLIALIEKSTDKVSPIKPPVGSAKIRGFTDWTDKVIPNIIQGNLNPASEIVTMYVSTDNGKLGFNEANYKSFIFLVQNILDNDFFRGKSSLEFIRKKSFEWLIELYSTGIFKSHLVDFIKSEIESSHSEFQFYFPIVNLDIEESFKIGNVQFMFFTEDYFNELFQSLQNIPNPITEKDFQSLYIKEYKGKVLAKTSVKSESILAESVALEDASRAIDVLKMYGQTLITPEIETNFDLVFRLNYPLQINYLSEDMNSTDGFNLHFKSNHVPISITNQKIINDNNRGLQTFSDFIKLKNYDELYNLIIQAINIFATALSNRDLHIRAVNLITILESLLLKDEEEGKTKNKIETRLPKLFPKNETENIKLVLGTVYNIRHKMIHKAIKVPINIEHLKHAQIYIIRMLLKLIELNTKDEKYTLKSSLIDMTYSISN